MREQIKILFFKVITTIVYIIFSQTYDKKIKGREVYVIIQFILLKPDFLIYESDT